MFSFKTNQNMTCSTEYLFILVMLVCWDEARTRPGDYSRDALISVTPNNAADRKYLMYLQRKNIVDLWNEARIIGEKQLMRVSRRRLGDLIKSFTKRKMDVSIVTPNLQRLICRISSPSQTLKGGNYDGKKFNFGQYHTFENIEKFLKNITKEHKDISKLENFGKSYEKRSMYAVEIALKTSKKGSESRVLKRNVTCSLKGSQKQKILIDCGVHAREWASISFCLYFIDALITGYKENKKDFKEILKKYDFIIIPVLNPDGYAYSRKTDRLWRKTRSKNPGSRCIGTDGNRNLWNPGECENMDPCALDYCGRKPFSESEIAALNSLLQKTKGTLKAYFNVHTFGEMWLIPWGKKLKRPKNYTEMMRVAKIGTKALAERFNTSYKAGTVREIMYPTVGLAIDYVYEKNYAKYSYALELRGQAGCSTAEPCGFLLPEDKIIPTSQETTDGVIAAVLAMK